MRRTPGGAAHRARSRPEARSRPGSAIAVAGLILTASLLGGEAVLFTWSRWSGLDQSLWKDETFSVLTFIRGGPDVILWGDYTINNHMLFNLLAWLNYRLFDGAETSLRFWSVLPATLAAVLLVAWVARRFGSVSAIVGGALITFSPLHTQLVRQARGYGLAYLAMTGVVISAIRVVESADDPRVGDDGLRRQRRWLVAFGASGLLGVLTFPFFALPFVLSATALAAVAPLRRTIGFIVAAVGAAGVVVYADALGQITRSTDDFRHHRNIGPLPWTTIITWPRDMFGATAAHAGRYTPLDGSDIRGVVWGLVVAPLLVLGAASLARHDRVIAAVLVFPIVGTIGLIVVARLALAERYWSYLIVPAIVLLLEGGRAAGKRMPRVTAWPRALAGLAGIAVGVAIATGWTNYAERLVELPREDFRGVGEIVEKLERKRGPIELLIASADTYGLEYYYRRPNYEIVDPSAVSGDEPSRFDDPTSPPALTYREVVDLACTTPKSLIVVLHDADRLGLDLSCIRSRGGGSTTLRQLERGERVTVWSLRRDRAPAPPDGEDQEDQTA